MTTWIPTRPTDKQAAFLWLTCREAFYGGAAGGGKSEALLMAALQYADVNGYAAILFRRTYADLSLPGALMDRAHEWLDGTAAHWSDKNKTWSFPSGASLTFGYLETERDKFRYQSAQFQYVGFDELTQFTETQYRYLFSRLRRLEGAPIPVRMRGASNPGGVGHEWVKRRLITEALDYGRVFIPAKLEDNPYLDREEYDKFLAELDPVTRLQLRRGDWTARAKGKKFKREWFQIMDAAPADLRWVRFWDCAATEKDEEDAGDDPDYTVGLRLGTNGQGTFFVADVQRDRLSPGGVESLILQTAKLDGAVVSIRMEQEPGSSGKTVIADYVRKLVGYDFKGIPSTGSKEVRANPVSAQAEAGNIKLIAAPWNGAFLDELEAFPTDGAHDDQVDGLSGAMADLAEVESGDGFWF